MVEQHSDFEAMCKWMFSGRKRKVLQIRIGHNETHHKANNKLLLSYANLVTPVLLIFKFFLLNHTSDLMRQQGNSGPVFEFCFFCFCFRGNNHNSSDLCKKYSEISLYKYSLQNKHIYTYLCTCRLFTNIDQKISASSDRVPINCNEEEVKPKLQSEKEVCLFFRRGCSLFLFVFSDKNSTFFSESVTVLSSLI